MEYKSRDTVRIFLFYEIECLMLGAGLCTGPGHTRPRRDRGKRLSQRHRGTGPLHPHHAGRGAEEEHREGHQGGVGEDWHVSQGGRDRGRHYAVNAGEDWPDWLHFPGLCASGRLPHSPRRSVHWPLLCPSTTVRQGTPPMQGWGPTDRRWRARRTETRSTSTWSSTIRITFSVFKMKVEKTFRKPLDCQIFEGTWIAENERRDHLLNSKMQVHEPSVPRVTVTEESSEPADQPLLNPEPGIWAQPDSDTLLPWAPTLVIHYTEDAMIWCMKVMIWGMPAS